MTPDRPWRMLTTLLMLLIVSLASAHATLVFVDVTTSPAPTLITEVTTIVIDMRDPVGAPVEDAIVFVEGTHENLVDRFTSDRFVEVDPGVYEVTVRFDSEGMWTLFFRDQTFRQEEAQATIALNIGPDGSREPVMFIFPPTATGPQSLTTWLIWLVGLPLVAGLIVTVMVLRGQQEDSASSTGEADA